MKMIYEAFDGKQFEVAEECLAYETKYRTPRMYGHFGDVEDSPSCAKYVAFDSWEAAQNFIDICKEEGTSFNGITNTSIGLYAWDVESETYFEIDKDAIRHVLDQEKERRNHQ